MRQCAFFAMVLLVVVSTHAATYFIDYSAGSDAHTGASPSLAWQRCPGMVGFAGAYTHSPGDVFIFRGGVVWPSAVLPLTIAYSGTVGHADTYTTDHSWYVGSAWTQPTLDGQLFGKTILIASGKGFFTINDIRVVNAGSLSANSVKAVEFSDCSDFELSNNTLAPQSWGCVYIWTSRSGNFNNYLIHHNDISACAFGIRIVPGAAASIINNVQIYSNKLHDFHSQLSGAVHGDGIQHYCSPDVASSYDRYINGFKIWGNSFTGDFSQVAGSTGAMTALIYLSGASQGVEIYNNLFAPQYSGSQSPNFFESFISLRDNPNRGGHHKIYNNTFVTPVAGGQAAALLEDDIRMPSPSLDIRNNIFHGFQWPFDIRSTNHTFDYNNVSFTRNVGKWGGTWVATFADWQRLGNDTHGISADPLFMSPTDFHLRAGSICQDRGALLGESYAVDGDGEPRPQGLSFDLGAFEVPARSTEIRSKDAGAVPAASTLPASVHHSQVFDLAGRQVRSAGNVAGESRLQVVVPEVGRAYMRPVATR